MAYYITDDGRVHEVDVEVKNDGSVRPQRYSDFVSTDTNQANNSITHYKHAKTRIGNILKMANIGEQIDLIFKKSGLSITSKQYIKSLVFDIDEIVIPKRFYRTIKKNGMAREKEKIIETIGLIKEAVILNGTTPSKMKDINYDTSNSLDVNQYNEYYLKKINDIIINTSLSEEAKEFILRKATSLEEIQIKSEEIKKMRTRGLFIGSGTVYSTFEKINNLIREYRRKYPQSIESDATRPLNKVISPSNNNVTKQASFPVTKPTVENKPSKKTIVSKPSIHKSSKKTYNDVVHTYRPLKGNEWTSGNYIRKGPAPKFGYARDRFGRVQERDSYREDKVINPYSINSSYDSEDDHDSMDILD